MVPCAAVCALARTADSPPTSNRIARDAADDRPIHLASNPRYFEFEGTTTPQIGTSGDYMISYCTDPDYGAMFDRIAASNLNVIRLFTYVPISWCGGGAYSSPWAGRHPTVWNESWFDRLNTIISAAAARHIVVEVVLFTQLYVDGDWQDSPLYTPGLTRFQFTSLDDPGLVAEQDEFVGEIVSRLDGYNNIYYEIANEDSTYAWEAHIFDKIVASDTRSHLVASTVGLGLGQIATAHYAVDLSHCYPGGEAWIDAFQMLDMDPASTTRAFDETLITFRDSGANLDYARLESWSFLVGGGSTYDNLCYAWSSPGADSLRSYLSVLKSFIAGFDLTNMQKANIIRDAPSGGMARASADPGSQYMIYIADGFARYSDRCFGVTYPGLHTDTITVHLEAAPPGQSYQADWVDPTGGSTLYSETFAWDASGERIMTSPQHVTPDIALRIKATP